MMKAKQASENAGLFQSRFLALMIWSTFDSKHVRQTASVSGSFYIVLGLQSAVHVRFTW